MKEERIPAVSGPGLSSPVTDTWAPAGHPAPPGTHLAPSIAGEGEVLGGRFLLRRFLGSGSSGTVFEALDHVTERRVALKVLRSEAFVGPAHDRLLREVELSRPGHPNVVTMYDLHQTGGFLALSMELVDGPSLKEVLARDGPLRLDDAVRHGLSIARALSFLHGKNLVHRDVKPGNILVDPRGEAKLADLGLVRSQAHGQTVTESVLVVGTPTYMAPEQALGRELTGKADVYALGLTLWECVTGRVPLLRDGVLETLALRQRERCPELRETAPGAPHWLGRLLGRMVQPDPRSRPTAREAEAALRDRRFRPLPRTSVLVRWAVAAVAVCGLVAGVREATLRRTAQVEATGDLVRGIDSRRNTTWEVRFESPVQQLLRVDLDGDGKDEVIATAYGSRSAITRIDQLPASEVSILTSDGKTVNRLRPEEQIGSHPYPFPNRLRPSAVAVDLDGDGTREILVTAPHFTFYPTSLFVYWPKWRVWDHALQHSGNIYGVVAIPGSPSRIRFLAINNPLGALTVVGELSMVPPPSRPRVEGSHALASADPGPASYSEAAELTAYVPFLGEGRRWVPDGGPGLRLRQDGGTTVNLEGSVVELDRFWNDESSPNRGADLRAARLDLMKEVGALWSFSDRSRTAESLLERRRALFETHQDLLRESSYRVALDLVIAKGMARAGAAASAIPLLRELAGRVPSEDVAYRLAELLAVTADLAGARATLRELLREGLGTRGRYDGPHLLLRVATESRDERDVATAIDVLAGPREPGGNRAGLVSALRARVRLHWDALVAADGDVRSWPFAPEGDATAVLARWRLGRTSEGDSGLMRRFVEGMPEEQAGPLALAAALLGEGKPMEAAALLEKGMESLEAVSLSSFEARQNHQLARALHAFALGEAGKGEEARSEARLLLRSATPGLLPAILARTVLERAKRREEASL